MNREEMVRISHRLIRLRLLGWILIGTWQVLSLASEFVRFFDLESRPFRIWAKATGLLGLVIVAYGFERFAEVSHRLAKVHE